MKGQQKASKLLPKENLEKLFCIVSGITALN